MSDSGALSVNEDIHFRLGAECPLMADIVARLF